MTNIFLPAAKVIGGGLSTFLYTGVKNQRGVFCTPKRYFSSDPTIKSSEPNPEKTSRFKQAMLNFVQNTNNQQQKLLVCHFFFLIAACAFIARSIELLGLAGLFLLALFITSLILNTIMDLIKSKTQYQVAAGFATVSLMLYHENYRIVVAYLGLTLYAMLKKRYRENTERKNMLITFWNDLDTMTYHLNFEFRIFLNLQRFNVFLILSFLYALYLNETNSIPVTSLWTDETFMQAQFLLLVVFFLNHMLFIGIRLVITRYCNPKFGLPHGIDMISVVSGGSAAIAFVFGVRELATHNPLPFVDPITPRIQTSDLGFKAHNKDEILLGRQFKLEVDDKPPVDSDGYINTKATRELIAENRLKQELKTQTAIRNSMRDTFGDTDFSFPKTENSKTDVIPFKK